LSSACANVEANLTCTSNDDCFENYACDLAQTNVCLRSCEDGDGCLASQFCDVEAGDTAGVCRHGEAAAAGDPDGDPTGDPDGDPTGDPDGD
jgi:hypothetical protein